jgi:hypothetical protein
MWTHPVAPLEILRNGNVAGIAHQEHDLLADKVDLGVVSVSGVIAQVVAVREEYAGNTGVLPVQIVEAEQDVPGQSKMRFVETGQHHAQPGAPALAP